MSSPDSNGEKIPNHGSGHLEISEKGFGFLRTAANPFLFIANMSQCYC